MKKSILYVILVCLFSSCDKDQIKQQHAEGWSSISNSNMEFVDVEFYKSDADTVSLTFTHYDNEHNFIYEIIILNVLTNLDSINLIFHDGVSSKSNSPIAYFYVKASEDTHGEHYIIDSTHNSFLFLESVTPNRIVGRFNLHFILSQKSPLPKVAVHIPDAFSITDGRFHAKKD